MDLRLRASPASPASVGPASKRRSRVIALAVIAVIAAACVAAESVPSAPAAVDASPTPQPVLDVAAVDPCALLSADALSAIVGGTVTTTSEGDAGGRGRCHYDVSTAIGAMVIDLLIDRAPATAGQGEAFLDELPQGAGASELHGVGDGAWWGYCDICPEGTDTSLTVIAAPLRFALAISGGRAETHQLIGEEIARAIIDSAGL